MQLWIEKLLTRLWNRTTSRRHRTIATRVLDLGLRISDDNSRARVSIPQNRRAEHVAVLGKTGTGKSSLLRYLAKQDIESSHGFVYFDLHGDATPFLLGTVAAQELATNLDLSDQIG
jgi:DNA helicase HerA-like ATPase